MATSPARSAIITVLRQWLVARGPAPRVLVRCDTCRAEGWRELPRAGISVRAGYTVDEWLRADVAVLDGSRRPVLLVVVGRGAEVSVTGGDRLVGCVTIALPASVVTDPLRWRPLRARGLALADCRCTRARAMRIVDEEMELRALGCPLGLHADRGRTYANVLADCVRCDFYVGVRYADRHGRRPELLCAFPRQPIAAPPGHRDAA